VHINPNNKMLKIRDISDQQAQMIVSAKLKFPYSYISQCRKTDFTVTSKAHDENQFNRV
jgi:hypothetical protein